MRRASRPSAPWTRFRFRDSTTCSTCSPPSLLAGASGLAPAGLAPAAMARAIAAFRGVSHRLETIAEIDGIRYVDDSIATTPERSVAGATGAGRPHCPVARRAREAVAAGAAGGGRAGSRPCRDRLRRGRPTVHTSVHASIHAGVQRGAQPELRLRRQRRRRLGSWSTPASPTPSPRRERSRSPATPCCWPPPAPPSTLTPTSPRAAITSARWSLGSAASGEESADGPR